MSVWRWEIENNDGYGPCYIVGPREVGSEVPNLIAQVIGDSAEAEDNARKMVAAPEMYELIEQVADLQNPRFDGAAYMELVEEMDRVADLAQDLLARIKGIEQDFASTSNGVSFLVQLLASLRDAVMFMEFTGRDRSLTAEERVWLEGARALLARAEKRE